MGADSYGHNVIVEFLTMFISTTMEVLSYVILPIWAGLVVWYAVFIERDYDE